MRDLVRTLVGAIGVLLLAVNPALAAAPPSTGAQQPGVTFHHEDDPEMNAAIAEARATLPEFLSRLDAGVLAETDLLKVAMPGTSGQNENIWVAEIRRDGEDFVGVLANEPIDLPGKHLGDAVSFSESMIVDWSYESRGRMWGNYTTRVVLPRIHPAQAAELLTFLSPTPIEP